MKEKKLRFHEFRISLRSWIVLYCLFPTLLNIHFYQKIALPLFTMASLEDQSNNFSLQFFMLQRLPLLLLAYLGVLSARKWLIIIGAALVFLMQFSYQFYSYTEAFPLTQLTFFYPLLCLCLFFLKEEDVQRSIKYFISIFFLFAAIHKLNAPYLEGMEFRGGSEFFFYVPAHLRQMVSMGGALLAFASIFVEFCISFFAVARIKSAVILMFLFFGALFIIAPTVASIAFLVFLPFLVPLLSSKKSLPVCGLILPFTLLGLSWVFPILTFKYFLPAGGLVTFLYSCFLLIRIHFFESERKTFAVFFLPAAAFCWGLLPLMGFVPRPLGFSMFSLPLFQNSSAKVRHYNPPNCEFISHRFFFYYSIQYKSLSDGCEIWSPTEDAFIRIQAGLDGQSQRI